MGLCVKNIALAEGIQTPALVTVFVTASQVTLDHSPPDAKKPRRDGASSWWAWVELNHRPKRSSTETQMISCFSVSVSNPRPQTPTRPFLLSDHVGAQPAD